MTMQTLQPARQLSPVEQFKIQVLPPERQRELRVSLPAHVRPELFERNFHNALMQNSWLIQHDPRLVYREIMKAAALGLLLDPQLGEGYLLEAWDGKLKRKVPQFRSGYRGLIKLARQSGEIAAVYAHAVHQDDKVECHLGTDKRLIHEPRAFAERGPVVGFYAVVKFKDGTSDFEPMNMADINRIRDRSEGYKAFAEGRIRSTPWSTDYDEMARKTVLRRLLKRLPQSPDLAGVTSHEDAADQGETIDVTPAYEPPATGPAAVAAALAEPAPEAAPDFAEVDGGDQPMEPDPSAIPVAETAGEATEAPVPPASVASTILTEPLPIPLVPGSKLGDWATYSLALQEAVGTLATADQVKRFRELNRGGINSLFKGNRNAMGDFERVVKDHIAGMEMPK